MSGKTLCTFALSVVSAELPPAGGDPQNSMGVTISNQQEPKKSRRGGSPEGVPPRRLTLERAPRHGRVALHLVIRQFHWQSREQALRDSPTVTNIRR